MAPKRKHRRWIGVFLILLASILATVGVHQFRERQALNRDRTELVLIAQGIKSNNPDVIKLKSMLTSHWIIEPGGAADRNGYTYFYISNHRTYFIGLYGQSLTLTIRCDETQQEGCTTTDSSLHIQDLAL